jgi:predicted dehydrogenase
VRTAKAKLRGASKVGFAVVGLGTIARVAILPAFANSKRARLIALVSRDEDKATRLARQFHAPHTYGLRGISACLANPAVQAVYIATPQGEHAAPAIAAARAGKHVLCEKPLAATFEQASRIVRTCRQDKVMLMTAYRKYYEPATRYVKRLVEEGALGRLDVIHTAFSELYRPAHSPAWLIDKKLSGGGPLTDLGVYCINTGRWLAGEQPVEASAREWRHNKRRFRSVEEGVAFSLHFPSGLVMQAATTYSAAISSFLYVQGEKGWLSLSPAFTFEDARRLTGKIGGRTIDRAFPVLDEFALELDAFARAIQTGIPVEPDGEQGKIDVAIIRAVYESARNGKMVRIRYT